LNTLDKSIFGSLILGQRSLGKLQQRFLPQAASQDFLATILGGVLHFGAAGLTHLGFAHIGFGAAHLALGFAQVGAQSLCSQLNSPAFALVVLKHKTATAAVRLNHFITDSPQKHI
jgi:hypothetical protein